jgi:CRISPR-associated protein Cas6/Cse3/CasE subtype I-E
MSSLTQVQLIVDIPAALRATPQLTHAGRGDESLVVKTVLTEGLGGAVIRPWRILGQHGQHLTVLGYTEGLDADVLNQRLSLGLPSLQTAITVAGSAPLAVPQAGQSFRFRIRCVPLISVTGARTRDAYTYECTKAGTSNGIDRAEAYARYLQERLPGATASDTTLDGFQLMSMVRRKQQGWSTGRFPMAELSGVLTVDDPAAFMGPLANGVGRMRAYGFGMLRLEAP